jgi:hypothetical protein
MSASIYQSILCNISEDLMLQQHLSENIGYLTDVVHKGGGVV